MFSYNFKLFLLHNINPGTTDVPIPTSTLPSTSIPLTVLFGLFHGVIFLPALLSWIGSNNIKEEKPEVVFVETDGDNRHNGIHLSEISEP